MVIQYQTRGWDQMFLTNFQLATLGDFQFFIIIKMLQKLCMYCVHTSLMISLVNNHIFNNDKKFNFILPHSQHILKNIIYAATVRRNSCMYLRNIFQVPTTFQEHIGNKHRVLKNKYPTIQWRWEWYANKYVRWWQMLWRKQIHVYI